MDLPTGAPDAVLIRVATPLDAQLLARFAEQIFRDTFGPDNSATDMDRYIATAFGSEYQLADITDSAGVVFVADFEGDIVAYAQLRHACGNESVKAVKPTELKRFYVAKAFHGCGLAQRLMDRAIEHATRDGSDAMWLAVFASNPRAISFYRKAGFREVGTQTFLLGADAQIDLVMRREIPG